MTIVLCAAGIIAGAIHFTRELFRLPGSTPAKPWVEFVHPNIRALEKAQGLVEAGHLREARQVCVHALLAAPQAPGTVELRDLLGRINTELFFQREPSPRKREYTVRRGDALASIARRLRSDTDAIMRINQLDSTMIRPGDTLLVPKLEFTITIDLPRDRVVVHDGQGFFTQYPVAAADLPPIRRKTVKTKVRAESFFADGKPVPRRSSEAAQATPWIYLQRGGYVLYGIDDAGEAGESEIAVDESGEKGGAHAEDDPDRAPRGIAMLKDDIAELELLIGRGTPVTVIRDQP